MCTTDLGAMSPLATNDGDDVTLTEPCFRGLGGGRGKFSALSISSASKGFESFFSTGSFDSDPGPTGMSSPKGDFPSDFDLRCIGRGGAAGFISEPDRLGVGGIGGARRLTISVGGRVFIAGGGGLEGGPASSNLGFAGKGGPGLSTAMRLSRSRLTEEQRIGGTGGGESDRSPSVSSALKLKTKGALEFFTH